MWSRYGMTSSGAPPSVTMTGLRRSANGGSATLRAMRSHSATFWRNLIGVGDAATFEPYGTPYCGKGEPNQVIRVGHASPVCLFADVDVFGGVQ